MIGVWLRASRTICKRGKGLRTTAMVERGRLEERRN